MLSRVLRAHCPGADARTNGRGRMVKDRPFISETIHADSWRVSSLVV